MSLPAPPHPHRLERLRAWLDDERLDCAVLFGADHVTHLCGYARYFGGPSALVVGRDGERTLVVMLDEARVARDLSDADGVVGYGERGFGLDLNPLAPDLAPLVRQQFLGSILDPQILDRILAEYEIDLIFHLAALLSTRSEFAPKAAHRVNVEGTMAMLEFAQHQGELHGRPVVFLYPSSIAAYGLPSLDAKMKAGKYSSPTLLVGEEDRNEYVIATNPAYRKSNIGYLAEATPSPATVDAFRTSPGNHSI